MERNQKLTKLSQNLRKQQTKEEATLWYQYLSSYPVRFRRQYVIGDYIVDFYCHKCTLVIELDGSQHYAPEEIEKDQLRTKYLESQGLCVLRFTNMDIQHNLAGVCKMIDMVVEQRRDR